MPKGRDNSLMGSVSTVAIQDTFTPVSRSPLNPFREPVSQQIIQEHEPVDFYGLWSRHWIHGPGHDAAVRNTDRTLPCAPPSLSPRHVLHSTRYRTKPLLVTMSEYHQEWLFFLCHPFTPSAHHVWISLVAETPFSHWLDQWLSTQMGPFCILPTVWKYFY